MVKNNRYFYPNFLRVELELVRGCKNNLCNTRFNCRAHGIEQKNMTLLRAQTLINHMEEDNNIHQIFLFASGDSTNWPYASKLKFPVNTKCAVSIVYPFLDKFPDKLKRMYRVNSLEDIELLSEKIRCPDVVHFVMSEDIVYYAIEMIKKIKELKKKTAFRFAVKSYNYYDILGKKYVPWYIIQKLLNDANIQFERIYQHYTSNKSIFINYEASDFSYTNYKVTDMKNVKAKTYIINRNSKLPLNQWAVNIGK